LACGNSGQVMRAGDHASQVQNFSSPDDLRLVIAGIAEIVRAFAPEPGRDGREEEVAALAVIGTGSGDDSVLVRFRDWAVTSLQAGANNAVVAAVSSTTTYLLIEAARLAGHLV
jgi:hypothetical protein